MFLLSTALAQVSVSCCSSFPCSMGMMMVENIPFFHSLAYIVMKKQGQGADAVSTLFVTFALSSLLVGSIFLLLGKFKLGNLVYFIPRHVIIGCIGGVGIFVTKTGLEVSTGVPWEWSLEVIQSYQQGSVVALWSTSICLVIFLRLLLHLGMKRYSLFPPTFFVMICPLFYAVVHFLPNTTIDDLRSGNWLFPHEESVPFTTVWTMFDFGAVRWDVVLETIPTIIALTVFSLMHVPINVPSLAASTGHDDVDMNDELTVHGYSNLLAGLFGTVQNYLVYSNSLLYWKCGGGGVSCGLILAAVGSYFFVVGPDAVAYVPRCMAGCLLVHLGLELVRESLVDSLESFEPLEYASVVVIAAAMTAFGMTEGLGVGVFLSLSTFTLQMAQASQPIRRVRVAKAIRSSRYRPKNQRDFLLSVMGNVSIVQLQGTLFFGRSMWLILSSSFFVLFCFCGSIIKMFGLTLTSMHYLTSGNATILCQELSVLLRQQSDIKCLIVDFTLIHYIDSSACDTIASVLKLAKGYETDLVFVRGSVQGFACRKHRRYMTLSILAAAKARAPQAVPSTLGPQDYFFLVVNTLDDALLEVEDALIASESSHALQNYTSNDCNGNVPRNQETLPPILSGVEGIGGEALAPTQGLKTLFPDEDSANVARLMKYLTRNDLPAGHKLWSRGEEASSMAFVAEGQLLSQLTEDADSGQEIVHPGNLVGDFAFLVGDRHTTTLTTQSQCAIYILDRQGLNSMTSKDAHIAFMLARLTISYLGHRTSHVSNHIWESHCVPI